MLFFVKLLNFFANISSVKNPAAAGVRN